MKESPEEMKLVIEDHEFNIEKRLLGLAKEMGSEAEDIRHQRKQIQKMEEKEVSEETTNHYSVNYTPSRLMQSATEKSLMGSEEGSSLSIKNLYRYHHETDAKLSPINRIHLRK